MNAPSAAASVVHSHQCVLPVVQDCWMQAAEAAQLPPLPAKQVWLHHVTSDTLFWLSQPPSETGAAFHHFQSMSPRKNVTPCTLALPSDTRHTLHLLKTLNTGACAFFAFTDMVENRPFQPHMAHNCSWILRRATILIMKLRQVLCMMQHNVTLLTCRS